MEAVLEQPVMLDETSWLTEVECPPQIEIEDEMAPSNDSKTIATLQERVDWTIRIGSRLAAVYAVVFVGMIGWMVTFYIPAQMLNVQNAVKSDVLSQIDPLKIQMAEMSGLLHLKETKDVSDAVRQGVNFNEPKYALGAITAIALQAKTDRITTPPSDLIQINESIVKAAASHPDLAGQAWNAQMALLEYRSSQVSSTVKGPVVRLPPGTSLPTVVFRHDTVDGLPYVLDGKYISDVTFTRALITYDGGPVALENVRFVDCKFQMKNTQSAEKLTTMMLAQNDVTGVVGGN